jgi:hypothetical protein
MMHLSAPTSISIPAHTFERRQFVCSLGAFQQEAQLLRQRRPTPKITHSPGKDVMDLTSPFDLSLAQLFLPDAYGKELGWLVPGSCRHSTCLLVVWFQYSKPSVSKAFDEK